MPWIVGLVDAEEKAELVARGYDISTKVPEELIDADLEPGTGLEYVNVWVGADIGELLGP